MAYSWVHHNAIALSQFASDINNTRSKTIVFMSQQLIELHQLPIPTFETHFHISSQTKTLLLLNRRLTYCFNYFDFTRENLLGMLI
jgi:hypothetical protein